MKKTIWQILFLLLIAAIGTMILFFASGCTVLKKRQSSSRDSVAVKTSDSTSVKKSETGSKYDSTWWREIISFLPKGGDSIINNTTVPVNNYYPSQIIREGGTISKEWLQRYMDSVNASKKDTTSVTSQQQSSSTERKILSFWQIIGLCAGVCFVMILISKLKISFK